MPSVPHINRIRRRRRKKAHRPTFQRAGLAAILFVSLFFTLALTDMSLVYASAIQDLPSTQTLSLLLEPPDGFLLQPTRFYDRSGTHVIQEVENPAINERVYLPIETIRQGSEIEQPGSIITATIAISDPTFWSNPGFSLQGIAENQHNTLAQKLVSTMLLAHEKPGMQRGLRERILAAQITQQNGREKVLEWYLNSTDYGNLAFGIEAAAQVYFGKPANQLILAEAAILAAVAESPALNPFSAPQTAIERGHVVIEAMAGQGLVTAQQAEIAHSASIFFQTPDPPPERPAAAFLKLAWEYLSDTIPIERLERGGFEIITSLDYELQQQISCATQTHLARLQAQAGWGNSLEDLQDCSSAQLLTTLTLDDADFLVDLGLEVVVLDPHSGEILAMATEYPATMTDQIPPRHPAGTLATPFIYLTAFTRGFSPASLVWDIPLDLDRFPQEDYQGPVRLRTALANDYLSPAVQVVNQIGIETVFQTTRQMGLDFLSSSQGEGTVNDCPVCRLVLQGGEISLVEAVQAYSIFSNLGTLIGHPSKSPVENGLEALEPGTIQRVVDSSQGYWLEIPNKEIRPVVSQQLSYLMLDILKDEDARWPSLGHPNPLEIGRPAGAKMGTTPNGSDVWTVGFTPQLVVGVWAGTPTSNGSETVPPKITSALWHAVQQYATQDYPAESWEIPTGITSMDVCTPSGMLPTLQCPAVVNEVFLTGQEPTQPDTLYQSMQVNRETGRLATVFTPPDLIESRIYLKYPPEASSWAESAGLETPPEIYDVIYAPPVIQDANIESPQMFAYIRGVVDIKGRASGDGFLSFRLQAGSGLNPNGWTVVQGDTPKPVEAGSLGTWDTSELNGLYALQLIVLRDDQRVDTTTLQVTVDNLPPELNIPYPQDGNIYLQSAHPVMTFLAQPDDNLGLQRVEFYLDAHLLATQSQPPYAFPWLSTTGRHVLTVKATDQAGNTSQTSVTFTIE